MLRNIMWMRIVIRIEGKYGCRQNSPENIWESDRLGSLTGNCWMC